MMPALVVVEPVGHDVQPVLPLASPVAEYLPAAQGTQVLAEAAPTVEEYVPAAHALQVPPFMP